MSLSASQLPAFVLTVDAGCRITEWNAKAVEISGILRDEALGKDVGDILDCNTMTQCTGDKKHGGIKEKLLSVLQGNESVNQEFILNSVDGKKIVVLLSIASLQHENHAERSAVAVGLVRRRTDDHKDMPVRKKLNR